MTKQEEKIMKGFVKITIISAVLLVGVIFAHEKAEIPENTDASIIYDGKNYVLDQSGYNNNTDLTKEEILLWEEDFENNAEGW